MGRSTPQLEASLLWLALAVGFSPILVNLAQNLASHPEYRVILLAPVLLLLAARSDATREVPGRRDGLVVVAVGALFQLLALIASFWTIGRLGLVLGAIGLARWQGHPRLAVMALLLFAIPLPGTVLAMPSPSLESALARFAAAFLGLLGLPVEAVGFSLLTPTGRIDLSPADGGALLAVALAALGWYAAARAGAAIPEAAKRALLWALLAVPIQPLVVLLGAGLLAAGLPHVGERWLTEGAWLLVAAIGLARIHRAPLLSSRSPSP